jgi:hypothetical protein
MTVPKLAVSFLAGLAMALAGCATSNVAADAPKPRNGIAEYHQITADAIRSVQNSLHALDRVSARTNPVPPRVSRAFSKAVERLEVESVQVRARSQAMQARGNAYFEHWQENLARMEDPRVRELARAHRAALEESFARIKLASQQTRQVFGQFFAGLRKLQTALENDPNAMAADSTQALVRATAESGRQVEACLAGIRDELKNMTEMLTPTKSGSKN